MNTDYNTILVERIGDFVLLTLNRPEKLNALNSTVINELTSLLTELQNPSLKVKGMIFTGEGEKAFIAGADIAEMSSMNQQEATEFAQNGQKVTTLFESLPFPVIAAVNGFALGGGCEMAMACDFIYATHSAVFGQPEVKLGLIPGFGGTQRLAKYIGRNKARYFIYSGDNMTAEMAKEYGLVLNLYQSKQEMLDACFDYLKRCTRNSPFAINVCKQVMNEANDLPLEKGLREEGRKFGEVFNSKDMQEGTKAFLEKRSPKFTGE